MALISLCTRLRFSCGILLKAGISTRTLPGSRCSTRDLNPTLNNSSRKSIPLTFSGAPARDSSGKTDIRPPQERHGAGDACKALLPQLVRPNCEETHHQQGLQICQPTSEIVHCTIDTLPDVPQFSG